MKLILENWRKHLNENVFWVDINMLLPSEELGHGKEHDCPSQECEDIINAKKQDFLKGTVKPIEVCNQAPINPHRTDGDSKAPKSGISEPVYFVLNGHHRLEAAKRLGVKKVQVYLTPLESRTVNEEKSYPLGEKDDIEKVSKVIIFDEDKNILILQRAGHMKWSSKKWDLPGGHWKKKETAKTAAKREVKEETGLGIKNLNKIGEVGEITVFKADLSKKDDIKLDDENSSHKWIKPEEIGDYDFVLQLVSFIVDLGEPD